MAYKNKENKVNKVNKENLQDDEISLADTKIYKKKNKSKKISNFEGYSRGINLEGYYIKAKGGVSKTFNAGATFVFDGDENYWPLKPKDLGTGSAFGFSVGKYLTDSFRLELEAIKRTGYEYTTTMSWFAIPGDKAKMQTEALFINGFYDFQPFTIRNTAITPYLGGGMGISRNKIGTSVIELPLFDFGTTRDSNSHIEFAYKLSAGTLVSLTEQLSLDVNYQYVNLGAFIGGTTGRINGVYSRIYTLSKGITGGEIKTQELMVGLQYKF